jgi:ATP-dependent protease HslVU (ClpYQ) peptidase subunit
MTTIAYRDGVLAADSQCQAGGRILGETRKITRIDKVDKPEMLVAVAGNLDKCQVFKQWCETGYPRNPPNLKEISENEDFGAFVIINTEPTIIVYEYETNCVGVPIRAEFRALGTGADFAIGAMAMGASARKAVEIATKYDIYTGGEIRELRFSS